MKAPPSKLPVRALKGLLALAVALCVGLALERYRRTLGSSLAELRPDAALLAAAFAVAVGYRLVNCGGWVLVLHALRSPLPVLTAVRLWLVSETMRWLPGSVWSYVSRVYAARRAGIDPTCASLSISLELFLTILAWMLTAAGGLACSDVMVRDVAKFIRLPGPLPVAGVGIALLGAALGGWIFIRARGWKRMPDKVRRLAGDLLLLLRRPPRAPYCLATLGLYGALCVVNGLNLWLVLRALSPVAVPVSAVIGINALGWLLGFFAFLAPGGLGVREAGIAGLLTLFYPLPIAVAGALMWRLLQIAAELFCLLLCAVKVTPAAKLWRELPPAAAENA